jgi:hypothetical protein
MDPDDMLSVKEWHTANEGLDCLPGHQMDRVLSLLLEEQAIKLGVFPVF